jgi:IPT/TIG domain
MSDTVLIVSGEIVRFPVANDHPLASYQQQLSVAQVSNLQDLTIVRAMAQAHPELSTDQITTAFNDALASSNIGGILQLTFPNLTVEEGATMVIDGPVTTLTAGDVIILGELIVNGSLNLTCSTLGGVARPIISSISPSGGSTRGGTQVEIWGSDFDSNTTKIYFGDTLATDQVQFTGSGYCALYSPPAASAGPVDITARVGGVFSSPTSPADVFTYVYLPGVASITVTPDALWTGETSTATVTVTLNEPATPEGTNVTLSITGPPGVTVPPSVLISPGETSATFPLTVPSSVSSGGIVVTATGPDGWPQSTTVGIYAGQIVMSLALPSDQAGLFYGDSATGTIFVNSPAPTSGGLITLEANPPGVVRVSPANVTLQAGSTSATFTLSVVSDARGFATITATYEGNSTGKRFPVNLIPRSPNGNAI